MVERADFAGVSEIIIGSSAINFCERSDEQPWWLLCAIAPDCWNAMRNWFNEWLVYRQNRTPEPPAELEFSSCYIRTGSGQMYEEGLFVITSVEELAEFTDAHICLISGWSSAFLNAIEVYTEEFFSESYLVIVNLIETSGSIRHGVDSVSSNGDIAITRAIPCIGTADIADWSIIIELDNSFKPSEFGLSFQVVNVGCCWEAMCPGCGDEYIVWNPFANECDFEDDSVTIVLTRCVSQADNRDWLLDEFADVGGLYLQDLSRLSDREWDLIQAGRWRETLVNWPEFRRIMLIRLDQNCKENVVRAIRQLEQHEFVRWVGPNYISRPD